MSRNTPVPQSAAEQPPVSETQDKSQKTGIKDAEMRDRFIENEGEALAASVEGSTAASKPVDKPREEVNAVMKDSHPSVDDFGSQEAVREHENTPVNLSSGSQELPGGLQENGVKEGRVEVSRNVSTEIGTILLCSESYTSAQETQLEISHGTLHKNAEGGRINGVAGHWSLVLGETNRNEQETLQLQSPERPATTVSQTKPSEITDSHAEPAGPSLTEEARRREGIDGGFRSGDFIANGKLFCLTPATSC
jgi:hypothetical protein